MPGVAAPPGTQQILDQGAFAISVPASAIRTIAAFGTLFPLLPKMGCRVYNVSLNAFTNSDHVSVQLESYGLGVVLWDGAELNAVTMWLDGDNFAQPTILDTQGTSLGTDGDPLIELFSAMLLTSSTPVGTSAPTLFTPAYLQLVAQVVVINNDAANPHTVESDLCGLLLFGNREAS